MNYELLVNVMFDINLDSDRTTVFQPSNLRNIITRTKTESVRTDIALRGIDYLLL